MKLLSWLWYWIRYVVLQHTYYFLVVVLTSITSLFLYKIGGHRAFYDVYSINYVNINNASITIFGVLFGFVFAILAILFSLREDSLFFQLVERSKYKRKTVINYFILSILSLSLTLIIFSFLTFSFFSAEPDSPAQRVSASLEYTNEFLVKLLPYIVVFTFWNVVLLLIFFVSVLKKDGNP